MLRSRLKLEEGWTSFLLLMFLLLSVVWSVRAAEWTEGLDIAQWISLAALLLGLLLAKWRRMPQLAAHLLSLVVGAAWLTFMLCIVFSPPIVPAELTAKAYSFSAEVSVMYQQMFRWLSDPSEAEAWLSNFMFIVMIAVLSWLLSYVSAWFIFRSHWVWGAVVPAGAACLLSVYYATPHLVSYFVLFCLCALLLIVRMHIYVRQKAWHKAAVHYNMDMGFTFMRDGALASLLALFLAWMIPAATVSPRLADFWANFQEPWHEVQNRWSRLFTSLKYQGRSSLVNFGPAMSLGGAVYLNNFPIFEVQATEAHYWRAVSYDKYTGSGWVNTDDWSLMLRPNDSRLDSIPYPMQREITYTVRMLEPGEDLLFFTGRLVRADAFARAHLAYMQLLLEQPYNSDDIMSLQATDVSMLEALKPLRRNQRYTVVSLVSFATVSQLRTAGTNYPIWVTKRYLQLPPSLPERVRHLSWELTQEATTPYDQAVAIQNYLRQLTYDQSAHAPPAGCDAVDWFLFEQRRGYCDYYATAMAVMCRAVGIPARISQGYTAGEYISGSRSYLVRQLDAHAWPEVYFPGFGWIEFEPTPSEPLLSRPVESSPPLPELGSELEKRTLEAEEKFGLTERASEDIVDFTLVRPKPWYMRCLYLALAALAIVSCGLLALFTWWYASLYGLSVAASFYEQVRRLGCLLGVPYQAHQTPAEYSDSLALVLTRGQDDLRYVVASYVKQRFSKSGLSETEEEELKKRWQKLRLALCLQLLTLRRRKSRLPISV